MTQEEYNALNEVAAGEGEDEQQLEEERKRRARIGEKPPRGFYHTMDKANADAKALRERRERERTAPKMRKVYNPATGQTEERPAYPEMHKAESERRKRWLKS